MITFLWKITFINNFIEFFVGWYPLKTDIYVEKFPHSELDRTSFHSDKIRVNTVATREEIILSKWCTFSKHGNHS